MLVVAVHSLTFRTLWKFRLMDAGRAFTRMTLREFSTAAEKAVLSPTPLTARCDRLRLGAPATE